MILLCICFPAYLVHFVLFFICRLSQWLSLLRKVVLMWRVQFVFSNALHFAFVSIMLLQVDGSMEVSYGPTSHHHALSLLVRVVFICSAYIISVPRPGLSGQLPIACTIIVFPLAVNVISSRIVNRPPWVCCSTQTFFYQRIFQALTSCRLVTTLQQPIVD